MKKLERQNNLFRDFIIANIYLFLPGPTIFIFGTIFYLGLYPFIEKMVYVSSNSCDFSAGGGSINLCNNDVWMMTLGVAMLLASIVAFVIIQQINEKISDSFKNALWGILLFYIIPLFWFIIHLIYTAGIYGNERGKINDHIAFVAIPSTIIVFLILGYINVVLFRKYKKLKTNII
jgi:hypothetical protein